MANLTVGYVSGVIALAVFIVQMVYPLLVGLVLVSSVGKKQSAVTWSLASRELLNTSWPTILLSDSGASSKISRPVKIISWMRLFLGALVAVTAVVTPLGLYTAVVRSDKPTLVSFEYLTDNGPLGLSTPPRSPFGFTRLCSHFTWLPGVCPGDDKHIDFDTKRFNFSATWNGTYDVRIPEERAVFFQSGLDELPSTVSSFFDIQYRQYVYTTQDNVNNNKSFPVGSYVAAINVVLDDALKAMDGLVVDTRNGKVGFRNHTGPTNVDVAADWHEDLLFIEPVTTCVDTNLTLEFKLKLRDMFDISTQLFENQTVIDRGGFINLENVTEYPDTFFEHPQENPEMHFRAWKLATTHNAYLAMYLNITQGLPFHVKSHIGERHHLKHPYLPPPNAVVVDPYSDYLNIQTPNPKNISHSLFVDEHIVCSGAGGRDVANISSVAASCGMVLGPAVPRDSDASPYAFLGSEWWTRSVHACASASMASIKTVRFRWDPNSGTGLQRLHVEAIYDKEYQSKSDMPVWAVEDTNKTHNNISPMWGLVSKKYANFTGQDYSVIQAPRLMLPGWTNLKSLAQDGYNSFLVSSSENIAGADAPNMALDTAYTTTDSSVYSGFRNLGILAKWHSLSHNSTSLGKMLNLIWTDVATNGMTGTRGQLPIHRLPPNLQQTSAKYKNKTDGRTSVPVFFHENRISYHIVFAIPAFVTLAFLFLIILAATYHAFRNRVGPRQIKWYLDRLSAGRLLCIIADVGKAGSIFGSNDEWIKGAGHEAINLDDIDLSISGAKTDPRSRRTERHANEPLIKEDSSSEDAERL